MYIIQVSRVDMEEKTAQMADLINRIGETEVYYIYIYRQRYNYK